MSGTPSPAYLKAARKGSRGEVMLAAMHKPISADVRARERASPENSAQLRANLRTHIDAQATALAEAVRERMVQDAFERGWAALVSKRGELAADEELKIAVRNAMHSAARSRP